MEDWVHRAIARWPNVPALYGWLGLDRRGRWLIRGETISRPQIVETIGRNYACDEAGRWYFQNGPQRGYVTLEYAPFVLRVSDDGGALVTHNDLPVERPTEAFLDEEGAVVLSTEHGPGLVADADLEWILARMTCAGTAPDEAALADALARTSGEGTALSLALGTATLLLRRLDRAEVPARLAFVRDPKPS